MMSRRDVLQAAAAAAAAAPTAAEVADEEIGAQERRLTVLADRDDGERWEYESQRNLAHVYSGLLNAELDVMAEEPDGVVETHAVGKHGVPLDIQVETDGDESVGTLVHLDADQAEALAVDLLEQAHAAREMMDR